jgi:UDP-N-acetylglucosamine--N-acetylmuramyl-(pentapeptide) pyrophosphoryl-undecaprenol N-acetylglucosamine transferase
LLADGIQVIHVTGTLDWPQFEAHTETLQAEQPDLAPQYHAFPYLHQDMALALAGADLVISRSGASVLGEFPLFGMPAILVPYPHAWRYQKVNAEYLVQRGAALMIEDQNMERDLLGMVRQLLGEPARLAQMRQRASSLAQPEGAWNVARELLRLAGETV